MKKEDILLSPLTKAHKYTEQPKKQRDNTKRNQNFDYTTIAGRLRTVSWGSDSHPTGVVKPRDPNLPTTHKSYVIKGTHI